MTEQEQLDAVEELIKNIYRKVAGQLVTFPVDSDTIVLAREQYPELDGLWAERARLEHRLNGR